MRHTGKTQGQGWGHAPARALGGHDLRILNAIRRVIRAVDIDSRRLAARHRVTSPQLMCLLALVERDARPAVEIARRIHVSPSTLVGVLDRLEAKGLVRRQRNTEDRREVFVTATRAGRTLAAKTPFPLQYSLSRVLHQLTAGERNDLAGWMERLVDLMGVNQLDDGPMLEISSVRQRQEQ